MATAWEILTSKSSAPSGSTAWEHLNSITGSGGVFILADGIDLLLNNDVSVVDVSNEEKLSVILSDSDITVTEDNSRISINKDYVVDIVKG